MVTVSYKLFCMIEFVLFFPSYSDVSAIPVAIRLHGVGIQSFLENNRSVNT